MRSAGDGRVATYPATMLRSALAIAALIAGVLVVPFTPQAALADTNCPVPAGSYGGGSGTAGDPWQIDDSTHLQRLKGDGISGWDDSFVVTADIDMGGCTWTSGIGSSNLSPFKGRLDGGGHVISGLSIEISVGLSTGYAGLVGYLASPGTITRIGFTGAVKGTATGFSSVRVGGLVGGADSGTTISYSFASGPVEADAGGAGTAGGLIGFSSGSTIDSYATGSATVTKGDIDQHAGGLAGYISQASTIRLYSTGVPQTLGALGAKYAGGSSGVRQIGTMTGTFWDTTASTTGSAYGFGFGTGNPVGKTTAQMQSFSTFDDSAWPIVRGWAPFDIASNKIWGICEGLTRPFLLWQYTAQTRPCASAPAAPTITGVTPSGTSASLAFTADDSGGSTITRLEFALDDTTTVDDSTTNVASPKTLSGLSMSTNYTVYMRAVNSQGTGPWSAPVAFRTQGRPGTPVVTGVIPDSTSASVAFTADDSGGSTILAIQFALDDTLSIDATSTNVSPVSLTGLVSSTSYTVYVRAMNSWGPSPWSSATAFTTLTPPPPPAPPAPIPPSAPLDARVTAGDASLRATWSAPAAPGSYPVTQYQATASPGGRSCMTTSTACTIDGLSNGTAYTVTVRALSGAGWSVASAPSEAVVPRADQSASLTITGSRGSGADRSMIRVRGSSTGLADARVTLWLAMGDRRATPAAATVQIKADGTFTWSRKLTRAVVIYAEAGGIRSNAITIPAR